VKGGDGRKLVETRKLGCRSSCLIAGRLHVSRGSRIKRTRCNHDGVARVAQHSLRVTSLGLAHHLQITASIVYKSIGAKSGSTGKM
jgi:hypothetical protein